VVIAKIVAVTSVFPEFMVKPAWQKHFTELGAIIGAWEKYL
jgi:hypothetical protein